MIEGRASMIAAGVVEDYGGGSDNIVPPTRGELLALRYGSSERAVGDCQQVSSEPRPPLDEVIVWKRQLELGEKACQGMSYDKLTTGPTDYERTLLDDKNETIFRFPGMDNKSLRQEIKRRDAGRVKICQDCEVKKACLETALAEPERADSNMIRGGTTLAERNGIRRKARADSRRAKS